MVQRGYSAPLYRFLKLFGSKPVNQPILKSAEGVVALSEEDQDKLWVQHWSTLLVAQPGELDG
eukprot:8498180-Prorocentrum_lima.AAC.1